MAIFCIQILKGTKNNMLHLHVLLHYTELSNAVPSFVRAICFAKRVGRWLQLTLHLVTTFKVVAKGTGYSTCIFMLFDTSNCRRRKRGAKGAMVPTIGGGGPEGGKRAMSPTIVTQQLLSSTMKRS